MRGAFWPIVTEREAGCDGRIGVARASELSLGMRTNDAEADGEVVWSWHPDAGAKLARDDSPMMGARKPGPQGERV